MCVVIYGCKWLVEGFILAWVCWRSVVWINAIVGACKCVCGCVWTGFWMWTCKWVYVDLWT